MLTCKHGNPLGSSCDFCRVERKADRDETPTRHIPGTQSPLPRLKCPNCDYTTPYRDALRRHQCQPSANETAQHLLDDLARPNPVARVARSVRDWINGIPEPKAEKAQKPKRPSRPAMPAPGPAEEVRRMPRVEAYLSQLCRGLGIRLPILILTDEMQNPGACGEAGQSTIWLQRQATLTREWSAVQATIRHEVAHILVHNTPGMGEAPAHGTEFYAALERVERVK